MNLITTPTNLIINSTLLAQKPTGKPLGTFDIPGLAGSLFYVDPGAEGESLNIGFIASISLLIGAVTIIGGVFFLFQIFIAALAWINAGDNENTISASRQKIIYSIIGIIVLIAAYALVALLATLLKIPFFNPLLPFIS